MFLSVTAKLSILLISFVLSTSVLAGTPTHSFASFPEYTALRDCAKGAYYRSYHDFANDPLSCNSNPNDACICRPDLISTVTNSVATYVSSACDNTVDASAAVTAYVDYCASAGYKEGNIVTKTTSMTIDPTSATQTRTVTVANPSGVVEGGAKPTAPGMSSAANTVSARSSLLGNSPFSIAACLSGVVFVSYWPFFRLCVSLTPDQVYVSVLVAL
jgi:hypothetical protein